MGQEHITTTLKNAIDNNQLAQALLFCGPRGVGKTTCARILARLINHFEPEGPLENLAKLNIYELDAASNNSVEDIRSLIDQVRYPPQEGKYKVYIIDEVHMLSNQAFNAFLKTLEEPPSYAIFILATTEKHKVIPTILSRCQIYDFNRIEIADITNQLKGIAEKEGIKFEDEALHLIAQKADGAMRDALSIFDLIVTFSSGNGVTYKDTIDNLHILDHDYYFRMTDHCLSENLSEAILVFDEILKEGFDGHNFIVGLSEHFRDLMVCQDEITIPLLQVADSVKEKYQQQAQQVSVSFLLSGLNILNQCDVNYKTSKNQRLHVELALMKLAHLNAAINLATVSPHPAEDKKKTELQKEEPPKGKDEEPVVANQPGKTSEEVSNKLVVTPNPPKKESSNSNRTRETPSLNIPGEEEPVEQAQEEEETSASSPFEEEDLYKVWDAYFEHKKGSLASFESMVLKKKPTLRENYVLELAIKNGVEINILKKMEEDLIRYLRRELNNSQISINHIQIEEKEGENLYTDMDKFNDMAKRNPVLLKLKDRLGLDPEY